MGTQRWTGSGPSQPIDSTDPGHAASRRMSAGLGDPTRDGVAAHTSARRTVLDRIESVRGQVSVLEPAHEAGLTAITVPRHLSAAGGAVPGPAAPSHPAPVSVTSCLEFPPLVPDGFQIKDLAMDVVRFRVQWIHAYKCAVGVNTRTLRERYGARTVRPIIHFPSAADSAHRRVRAEDLVIGPRRKAGAKAPQVGWAIEYDFPRDAGITFADTRILFEDFWASCRPRLPSLGADIQIQPDIVYANLHRFDEERFRELLPLDAIRAAPRLEAHLIIVAGLIQHSLAIAEGHFADLTWTGESRSLLTRAEFYRRIGTSAGPETIDYYAPVLREIFPASRRFDHKRDSGRGFRSDLDRNQYVVTYSADDEPKVESVHQHRSGKRKDEHRLLPDLKDALLAGALDDAVALVDEHETPVWRAFEAAQARRVLSPSTAEAAAEFHRRLTAYLESPRGTSTRPAWPRTRRRVLECLALVVTGKAFRRHPESKRHPIFALLTDRERRQAIEAGLLDRFNLGKEVFISIAPDLQWAASTGGLDDVLDEFIGAQELDEQRRWFQCTKLADGAYRSLRLGRRLRVWSAVLHLVRSRPRTERELYHQLRSVLNDDSPSYAQALIHAVLGGLVRVGDLTVEDGRYRATRPVRAEAHSMDSRRSASSPLRARRSGAGGSARSSAR